MAKQRDDVLKDVLDRHTLQRIADPRSFARGEEYRESGQVKGIVEQPGGITAKVRGTREYRVKLCVEDGDLGFSCTCPVGTDGSFCKHCVAVGLAWLDRIEECAPAPGKPVKHKTSTDDVRAYLAAQDKDVLIDMLMQQSAEDDRLRQRLFRKAAKWGAKGLDVATFRQSIDDAIDPGGYVDYRAMHDYAQGIEDTIDSIDELLKDGYSLEVMDLAEHALAAVEGAMGSVDDSDGYMGSILERLQEIHHAACKKARPDPEALARRLFAWELRTDWDTFSGAAEGYADILGEKGLAVYGKLAKDEWARVPALGPGRDDRDRNGRSFRITQIMETLARQSGEVEAVVEIMKRDLSSACSYIRIAETYKHADRHDQALEWAERGLKAFPEKTAWRLREFLADEYHRRKRHDEAMALVWAEFEDTPRLDMYQKLKKHADRLDRWTEWREKALARLRERTETLKREARKSRWAWSGRADHSDLVRVFLWEKNIETAWREAKAGGCSDDLWRQLATEREEDHPEDAMDVYRQQIEPTLARKNNEAYKEAVRLLGKVRELHLRLGREAEFTRFVVSVRSAHKPKRNFMKALDRANWK